MSHSGSKIPNLSEAFKFSKATVYILSSRQSEECIQLSIKCYWVILIYWLFPIFYMSIHIQDRIQESHIQTEFIVHDPLQWHVF